MSMVPCGYVPEIVMKYLVWWVIYCKIILNGCDLRVLWLVVLIKNSGLHPIRDLSAVYGKHKDFRNSPNLKNTRILQIRQRHTYSIQGELQQHRRSL